MDAIFNLCKPAGMTSHQAVAAVRRASGERRMGHAGTLDPAAEGVLLICAGAGTRVVEYLMQSTKTYCAEVCLGVETDTYDGEGRVTRIAPVEGIDWQRIEAALARMVGVVQQVPPVYSALKREGVPLYRLAREGRPVHIEARTVHIYEARLVAYRSPVLRVIVRCSPGTYIRSLAHDLGQILGCGAHMSHLVRLASGRFTLEEAVDLHILQDAFAGGYWSEFAYPVDEALLQMDAILLGQDHERRFRQGGDWPATWPGAASGGRLAARSYSLDGKMVGIAMLKEGRWWPHKVFA